MIKVNRVELESGWCHMAVSACTSFSSTLDGTVTLGLCRLKHDCAPDMTTSGDMRYAFQISFDFL